MTTSRVIRGTRGKVFIYVCAILIITGIIACYNNTLSQLEDARKASENCLQHKDNLAMQLQGLTSYKETLESSLREEKKSHQNTKNDLENKAKEKNKCEEDSKQSDKKFSSLQQHFNLLQTEYGDYRDTCNKTQTSQQAEINDLKKQLSDLQDELKEVKASKEKLKVRVIPEVLPEPKIPPVVSSEKNVNQVPLVSPSSSQANKGALKPPDTNAYQGQAGDNQIHPFLAEPGNGQAKGSSSTSTIKSALKPSQGNLEQPLPLKLPTITPSGKVVKNNGVVLGVMEDMKMPKGVVPAPENQNENPNEQHEVEDNRYKNVKENVNIEPAADKVDLDKENGAHEEFDNPQNGFLQEGLGFGDIEHNGKLERQDRKLDDAQNLKEEQEFEENEEDEDAEGYEDRAARRKDPAVRN